MSEKPKQKPSRLRKWMIGLGVVSLLALAGFCLLSIYIASLVSQSVFQADTVDLRGDEAREFIESEPYSLPLPTNAQDIYLHYTYWQEVHEYIRFSASPESIETWLNGNDFCFTQLNPNVPLNDSLADDLDWWTPNESPFSVGSETCGTFPYYKISIDQINPALWIIYLVIYTI